MLPRTAFLHCGWRTASTYLWSRFRALDNTVAYNEPLHELLARMPPDGSDPNADWDASKRGHPAHDKPFAEFVPLAKNGLVAGYHPRFATGSYFLAPRDNDDLLKAYIEGLQTHANHRGKHAVYGFCRSLGRVGWLRKNFPDAYNIVLTRRPYDHWQSCALQLAKNRVPYFLLMPVKIVGENQRRIPELRAVARQFSIPEPQHLTGPNGYTVLLSRLPAEAILSIFLEVYALAYTHAISHADLVLSIEDFSSNDSYRAEVIDQIEAATGLRITPGDLNLTRYTAAPGDIFAQVDLRRISTLTARPGDAIDRTSDAVAAYSRALKADIGRARRS
jgi:hypothetical protein